MAAVLTTFSGQYRVSLETVAVTGTTTDHDTGLNTIIQAFTTVKATAQGTSAMAYVTVNFGGTDGLIDLYAWDDTGVAAAVAGNVMVLAVGT